MPFLKITLLYPLLAILLNYNMALWYVQEHLPRHYQVKAAFLYNFTQFVEWPDNSFPSDTTALVIGLVGEDPFGSFLEEVIQGEEIKGHPLSIRRFEQDDEIRDCHILFINLLDDAKLTKVLDSLKGQSVLTVGDAPGFLEKGGMIRFIAVDNKIQFQINPDASNSAELKISSKLLRLAQIVTLQNP